MRFTLSVLAGGVLAAGARTIIIPPEEYVRVNWFSLAIQFPFEFISWSLILIGITAIVVLVWDDDDTGPIEEPVQNVLDWFV